MKAFLMHVEKQTTPVERRDLIVVAECLSKAVEMVTSLYPPSLAEIESIRLLEGDVMFQPRS